MTDKKMKGENLDFKTEKVSVLFKKIFYPTLLGMLSMSAVTVVDGILVGQGIGSDAIAAVNISIPLLMILTGIGLMVGVGSSVIASINLSRGKKALARANIVHALLFVTIVTLILSALIYIFPEKTAYLLGSSDHLSPMVVEYLLWFTPSLVFELVIVVSLFALRLDGAPKLAMWCSVIAAVTNLGFDWIFIFPLGWGLMGSALGTTLSCLIGAGVALIYLFFYAHDIRFSKLSINRRRSVFFLRNIGKQCKIGSSALLGEATMATLMFTGNHVFMHYLGDNGVAAFGISCFYLPFVFMIGNAVAQSVQPIISYNFGIKREDRISTAFQLSLKTALICGSIVTAAFIFLPKLLVGLFLAPENEAAKIAVNGFPYYSAAFVFFVVNLSVIGYCQSIGKVKPATLFALLRGFIFLIPSYILLPKEFDRIGLWLALPLSEILTTIVIVIIFGFYRNSISKATRIYKKKT